MTGDTDSHPSTGGVFGSVAPAPANTGHTMTGDNGLRDAVAEAADDAALTHLGRSLGDRGRDSIADAILALPAIREALAAVAQRDAARALHRQLTAREWVVRELLPADLPDDDVTWMAEARTEAGVVERCIECDDEWPCATRRALGDASPTHDCATCTDCIHDGHKCCGCYDGACCRTLAGDTSPTSPEEPT